MVAQITHRPESKSFVSLMQQLIERGVVNCKRLAFAGKCSPRIVQLKLSGERKPSLDDFVTWMKSLPVEDRVMVAGAVMSELGLTVQAASSALARICDPDGDGDYDADDARQLAAVTLGSAQQDLTNIAYGVRCNPAAMRERASTIIVTAQAVVQIAAKLER